MFNVNLPKCFDKIKYFQSYNHDSVGFQQNESIIGFIAIACDLQKVVHGMSSVRDA